jgi:GNAT superfamily N-acetyltransferase
MAMIEIRPFEGDEAELSAFTTDIWRKWYTGKMPVPLWSPAYFRRELFSVEDGSRDHLVCAYDGAKLIGSHPVRPLRILLHGEEKEATWGSYLTVDPEYRRQGVAKKMQDEQERYHRERGAVVNLGYLYVRTAKSLGRKFWLKVPEGTTVLRKLGVWGRALDHKTVSRFETYRLEAFGTRLLSLFQGPPREPADMTGIRPYRQEDRDECAALVRQRSEAVDLGYLWSPQELGRFFHYQDLADTVVLEQEGRVAGLANYFRLGFLGRCELDVGVLDFVAFGDLPRKDRVRLLRATLCRMAGEGLKAAMLLRGSWYSWRTFWAAGFFPLPPEYFYVGTKMLPDARLENVRRVHAIWR